MPGLIMLTDAVVLSSSLVGEKEKKITGSASGILTD